MTKQDWIKIATGAAIAAAGASLAYLAEVAIPLLEASSDIYILSLAAALSALVNAGRKWLAAQE